MDEVHQAAVGQSSRRERARASKWRLVAMVLVVLLAMALTFGVSYWGKAIARSVVAHQRLRSYEWCGQASDCEIRAEAHAVLNLPFGNHHDAFLFLERVGTLDSVPYLLKALKAQPLDDSETWSCSREHCVDALRAISGRDLGREYGPWEKWWQDAQRSRCGEQQEAP